MLIKTKHNVFLRTNNKVDCKQSIWFLHGFADSGLAYKEVFSSTLNQDFAVYVVDLPGFGVSPLQPDYPSIKDHAELMSKIIKEEINKGQTVSIVSHSLGSLIGTWICQELGSKISYFFNIEGNLTEADSYFSSKPLKYNTTQAFSEAFNEEVFHRAKDEERYKRYYSSLRFANVQGMENWSRSSQEFVKGNKCGYEFLELDCNKCYIWGDVDTPYETQKFIKEHSIPNTQYKGIGHWHMVENPVQLYDHMHQILKTL